MSQTASSWKEGADEEMSLCPECHSHIVERGGELVCEGCGLVIGRTVSREREYRTFDGQQFQQRERVGSPLTYAFHDKGLSTKIGGGKDGHNIPLSATQRQTIHRLQVRDYYTKAAAERNLTLAMMNLSRLSDQLHLTQALKEQAAVLYRKVNARRFMRGRSIAIVMAACVYATCKFMGVQRNLNEVARASGFSRTMIHACYRDMYWLLDLKIPVSNVAIYVSRIGNFLGLSGQIQQQALALLEKAKRQGMFGGRNLASLSAAAIYLTAPAITQKQVANAANVTEVTVRNRTKEMRPLT